MRRILADGARFFFLWGVLQVMIAPAWARPIDERASIEVIENLTRQVAIEKTVEGFGLLGEVKYWIINGNLDKADRLLRSNEWQTVAQKMVQLRYLFLVLLLKEKYSEAWKLWQEHRLQFTLMYRHNCMQVVLMRVLIGDLHELDKEFYLCSANNIDYTTNEHRWMETLVLHLLKSKDGLSAYRDLAQVTSEQLRVWLKLVLVLGLESQIDGVLEYFDASMYHDVQLRELLGLIYYRKGKFDLAADFVKNISTANSENVLGNLALRKKQYEFAYGHFQVAIKKKTNSYNAIERLLPLAWKLGKWSEGVMYAQKLPDAHFRVREKTMLMALFETKNREYERAFRRLLQMDQLFMGKHPTDVSMLLAYLAIQQQDAEELERNSQKACLGYDGVACLVYWEHRLRKNFLQVAHSPNAVINSGWTVDQLKAPVEKSPLEDTQYIDQMEIEEMDNELLQISRERLQSIALPAANPEK